MTPLLTFVIAGRPVTKKNHGRRIKRGNKKFNVPSLAYEEWNASAQQQFMEIRAKAKIQLPITCNVNVRALFFRKTAVGDICNFFQAIADSMQDAGIIEDDKQITQWDGSRLLLDKDNPRIIVSLEKVEW